MSTKRINEVASHSFVFMLIIIALAVISTCLIFSLVLSQNLNKLEIVLLTLLLLSSVLSLIFFSYRLVNQVHTETERINRNFVNEVNKNAFRKQLIGSLEMQIDELAKENSEFRQKEDLKNLLSKIDALKDVPEKEKIQEPVKSYLEEDIFGGPDDENE